MTHSRYIATNMYTYVYCFICVFLPYKPWPQLPGDIKKHGCLVSQYNDFIDVGFNKYNNKYLLQP